MRHISIFGTSSDAGKSTLTFVIAKILQRAGIRVAPFKASWSKPEVSIVFPKGQYSRHFYSSSL